MAEITRHIVVYADDDQDDLELMRDAFDKYTRNVSLVSFSDGSSVLQYLRQLSVSRQTPCLVILDINLPVIDGKEILQKLRSMDAFKETPVVLFTTSSQPHDKRFARQFNASFFTKPISYQQMELITDQFIEYCADEIKKNIKREVL